MCPHRRVVHGLAWMARIAKSRLGILPRYWATRLMVARRISHCQYLHNISTFSGCAQSGFLNNHGLQVSYHMHNFKEIAQQHLSC